MDETKALMDMDNNERILGMVYRDKDNAGAISIEIILVLVVLVALVIIFKSQIVSLANSIWTSINTGAKTIFS